MSEERITYDEFMIMLKFAPKMCYTLYDKAEDEIDRLNNIINELEKWLDIHKNTYLLYGTKEQNQEYEVICYKSISNKLKELKDSDKE